MNLEKNMRNIFGHAFFAAAVSKLFIFITCSIEEPIFYLISFI